MRQAAKKERESRFERIMLEERRRTRGKITLFSDVEEVVHGNGRVEGRARRVEVAERLPSQECTSQERQNLRVQRHIVESSVGMRPGTVSLPVIQVSPKLRLMLYTLAADRRCILNRESTENHR